MKNRKLSHLNAAPFDKFYFGAAYYPEHWAPEALEKDAKRMQDAKFNVVRLAEFAWDMLEPQEGDFQFDFFDNAIETLAQYGIKVFLSTPTAAPPRWLTQKHPEILRINGDNIAMEHGSRQHACHSNATFREYSKAITRAMANHFKDNPNVVGWQTDNEFNCHFSVCYCEECQREFRNYLSNKYQSIDELNQRWGSRFWATTYDNFEQINLPRAMKPTYSNPSHLLEQARFISHSVTVFQQDQVEILRELNSSWIIFHNGLMNHIDYHGDFSKRLYGLGYDVYPMFHYNENLRGYKHMFNLDQARALAGNFIVPEHQSGPGGQRLYMHNTPDPNEIRMMSYRSIARGADALLYFRWRTCRFGAEQYWCGILDHDDVPRRRYHEIASIGKDLEKVGDYIIGSSVHIDAAIATGDYDVEHAQNTFHMGMPEPIKVAEVIHKTLASQSYSVGCVHPDDNLSNLKLYFIPHWELIKQEWLPNLEAFVAAGGTLVIGARSGTRNEDNLIVEQSFPGLLSEMCGVTIEDYSRKNEDDQRDQYLNIDGKEILAQTWVESLKLTQAQSLALWSNRYLKNQVAISHNRYKKGNVVYVGTYFTPELCAALTPKLIEMSQLTKVIPNLPSAIEVVVRKKNNDNLIFLINGKDEKVDCASIPNGELLLGENSSSFSPYEVKILLTKTEDKL